MEKRLKEGQTREQSYLGYFSLQTLNRTVLPWSRGTCGQEPSMVVPGEVQPATDRYECRCLEPTIRVNSGNLVGELAKDWKKGEVLQTLAT